MDTQQSVYGACAGGDGYIFLHQLGVIWVLIYTLGKHLTSTGATERMTKKLRIV